MSPMHWIKACGICAKILWASNAQPINWHSEGIFKLMESSKCWQQIVTSSRTQSEYHNFISMKSAKLSNTIYLHKWFIQCTGDLVFMGGTKFLPGWLTPRQMVVTWNTLLHKDMPPFNEVKKGDIFYPPPKGWIVHLLEPVQLLARLLYTFLYWSCTTLRTIQLVLKSWITRYSSHHHRFTESWNGHYFNSF